LPPDALQRGAIMLREAVDYFLSMLGSAREMSDIAKRLSSAFAVADKAPKK
jgi:hypothetical protein